MMCFRGPGNGRPPWPNPNANNVSLLSVSLLMLTLATCLLYQYRTFKPRYDDNCKPDDIVKNYIKIFENQHLGLIELGQDCDACTSPCTISYQVMQNGVDLCGYFPHFFHLIRLCKLHIQQTATFGYQCNNIVLGFHSTSYNCHWSWKGHHGPRVSVLVFMLSKG